jgi:hypothetical protein
MKFLTKSVPILGLVLLSSVSASALGEGDDGLQDPVALRVFRPHPPVQIQDSMASGGNGRMISPLSLGSPYPSLLPLPDGVGFTVGIVPVSTSPSLGSYFDVRGFSILIFF